MTTLSEHHCCSGCDATGHCTHGYEDQRAAEKERLAQALRDGDEKTFIAAVRKANQPALPRLDVERLAVIAAARRFLEAHDHVIAAKPMARDDAFAMKNAADVLRDVLREYDLAASKAAQ